MYSEAQEELKGLMDSVREVINVLNLIKNEAVELHKDMRKLEKELFLRNKENEI